MHICMVPAQGKGPAVPSCPQRELPTPPPQLCVTLSLALPFSIAAESWIPKHSIVSFGVL